MKRVLPAIALVLGLGLAGCSSDAPAEDSSNGADSAAEQTTAEDAPAEAAQLDEDALKSILESTTVGDTTFTVLDTSAVTGGDAATDPAAILEDAEFSPESCKSIALAAFAMSKQSGANTIAGAAMDAGLTVGLSSFTDTDAAAKQFAVAQQSGEECKSVTITTSGVEMTMKAETFAADVDGADNAIGTKSTVETGAGQPLTINSVTSQVGTTLVSYGSFTGASDDADLIKGSAAFVDAVKNAA